MTINLVDLLQASADRHPDKTFVYGEQSLSYKEVNTQAQKFVNVLISLGVKPGDPVALLTPNHYLLPGLYSGGLRKGSMMVLLSMVSPASELAHSLKDAKTAVLVAHESALPVAREAFGQAECCRHLLVIGQAGEGPEQCLEDLMETVAPTSAIHFSERKDTAALLYSSGTTGRQKAIRMTHETIATTARIFGHDILQVNDDDVILMVSANSHSIGHLIMNVAMTTGIGLSMLPKFELSSFIQTVKRDRVTALIGVPTLLQILTSAKVENSEDIKSIRAIGVGGAFTPPKIAQEFISQYQVRLMIIYAMTEAGAMAYTNFTEAPHGSVGTVAPNTKIRIVDESGREVPIGEPGEIIVHGPQVCPGYLNLPGQKEDCWFEDWFRTGDVGYLDQNGNLFIEERLKELIKTPGCYTVYPAEVERVLLEHPSVAQVAVVGKPQEKIGELIQAYVTPKSGTSVSISDLDEHCSMNLAKYKRPHRFILSDHLPVNNAGKIDRSALKRNCD